MTAVHTLGSLSQHRWSIPTQATQRCKHIDAGGDAVQSDSTQERMCCGWVPSLASRTHSLIGSTVCALLGAGRSS